MLNDQQLKQMNTANPQTSTNAEIKRLLAENLEMNKSSWNSFTIYCDWTANFWRDKDFNHRSAAYYRSYLYAKTDQ